MRKLPITNSQMPADFRASKKNRTLPAKKAAFPIRPRMRWIHGKSWTTSLIGRRPAVRDGLLVVYVVDIGRGLPRSRSR